MSRREEDLYAEAKAEGYELEPYETMFFFPTKEDQKLARKLAKRLNATDGLEGAALKMSVGVGLVANGTAVPVRLLDEVRELTQREDMKFTGIPVPARFKSLDEFSDYLDKIEGKPEPDRYEE